MLKRLIVNADDYGISPLVSQGIRDAHLKGIVTSTSIMINFPGAPKEVVNAQRETPKLGLGLHFTLTGGSPPVSRPDSIPSLVTADGVFPELPVWSQIREQLDPLDVEREARAQFDKFVSAAGRLPDHLDAHHHCLYWTVPMLNVLLRIADEHQLPIRTVESDQSIPLTTRQLLRSNPARVMPDHFVHSFFYFERDPTLGELLLLLADLQAGDSELMCHPGYYDADLIDWYRKPRAAEVAVLTAPSARELLKAEGVTLINFSDLGNRS